MAASDKVQAAGGISDGRLMQKVESAVPRRRQDVLKWYGWGYKDSRFTVKDRQAYFEGIRYPLAGCYLPYFTEWVLKTFDIQIDNIVASPEMPTSFPEPVINEAFVKAICSKSYITSDAGEDRLVRCHGQTLHDIYTLRNGEFKRIPDLVVWPSSHEDVVDIIRMAEQHNVVVIPFGGGTSVSGSITCPEAESRMIVALDTSQMNKMLWLDRENLTACFEAGILGQDLEQKLKPLGLTVGHEPDSYEFSTLGGWVATRASGMKKNVYGNIEDLLIKAKLVTPRGVLIRECAAPRVSCGPDLNHVIMGSEGNLGVITEVVLKVRPLPPVKRYGSLVFPDFESGVKFMREVARRRCQPASVRLIDNEQFVFGQSLKPMKSWFGSVMDAIKQKYVTNVKGLDLKKICAATLLFEGESEEVRRQEEVISEIARQCNGFPAGGENGERGYILTFVIAYIRDFALNFGIVAESFETSVPWNRCLPLCRNVKRTVEKECARHNITHFLISCRVTQTYDAGCCVYFYFGFKYSGLSNPVETYEMIETAAREEILASGGSLSHHHGVGKIRSKWYPQTVSEAGVRLYKAAKDELDPKNIFAAGNLLPDQTHSAVRHSFGEHLEKSKL